MEVALDFAINCSPDHPYVAEHPEWFYKRPDGTIKYAENPPKKYEDIYPLNFRCPNWQELWDEMTSIILFWAERGVRIFRVDNPHTKPVPFWEYLIARVRAQFPDTIFLSEAFTKPKMMKALAKAGFTQSYTYFTWRKHEAGVRPNISPSSRRPRCAIISAAISGRTRPTFCRSTCSNGGRPAFMIARRPRRHALERLRHLQRLRAVRKRRRCPGREEYLDSEKYQWKERDWDAPGNIKDWITRLNRIRQENRALHLYDNLRFYRADNDNILFYGKMTPAKDNIILVVVNLDAHRTHNSYIHVPLEDFGAMEARPYQVHDLLTDARYIWHGSRNYVELDPLTQPAHIFRVRRSSSGRKSASA